MSATAAPIPELGTARSRFETVALVLTFLIVGWFDLWTMESTGHLWKFGTEQNDYYNLLIDGWLDGQLHMKVAVPDALLRTPDPYDPKQRPDVGLHDASLYRGKYYLYFGAAPLVLLMLPFRILTGIDLPVAFATITFVYAGFLVSAMMWLDVRRRYFPATRTGVAVMGVLVLGIASLVPLLLRRPQMWELPIAAGYCFAMTALWSLWRSLHSARRRTPWLAGAAVALGLAIASRPPYLYATPILIVPLLLWWREERRLPWQAALGVALPLAFIGGLMALHNALRFGSPLEFGQTYQLTYYDERKMPHFSLGYAGFNAWRYFFSRPQWSPYFPFIAPAELPPKPPGFSGHDDLYGVLSNLPFGWLAILAPLAFVGRSPADRRRLGVWLGAVALLFAVMTALLLCFFGSLARYEVDFTPALMLLACVGMLALERQCADAPVRRRLARAVWAGAAIFALGFAVLFTLQCDAQLQGHNPTGAAAVARVLNWIPYVGERLVGVRHGAVECVVMLKPHDAGDEVLLTLGEESEMDSVLVRHLDAGRVQLVVTSGSKPEIASRPVPLDFARAHAVRVALGSLLPPETHPMFRGRAEAERMELTRQIRVELDGETLIDERRDQDAGGRRLRVGREALAPAEKRFQGEVRHVRRIGSDESARRETAFVRLRLSFPASAAGATEPLFGFQDGAGTIGGVIFVHYLDDFGQLEIGSSVGGKRLEPSTAISADPQRSHEVVVCARATADMSVQHVEVRLDGVIAWAHEMSWPAAGVALVAGRNIAEEPGCARVFSGQLHSVQPAAGGRDPLQTAKGDTVNLRVRFPTGRKGMREPLLVTGQTEAGDLLLVEYVDDRTIQFMLDHWGGQMLASDPVAIDFGVTHSLTIATSALWGKSSDIPLRMIRKGALRVELDQVAIWRTAAPAYAARPDEIAVGFNPIGGTSASARFTGDILSAERTAR